MIKISSSVSLRVYCILKHLYENTNILYVIQSFQCFDGPSRVLPVSFTSITLIILYRCCSAVNAQIGIAMPKKRNLQIEMKKYGNM